MMSSNPRRELLLAHLACRKCEHSTRGVRLIGEEAETIQSEKKADRQESGSFVAVREEVIAHKSHPVGCGQAGKVGLRLVAEDLARPRQRGVKKPFIENARMPSVFRKALPVQEDWRAPVNPLGPLGLLHFAKARNVPRYFAMNSRPSFNCFSTSGS